ncbi:Sodium/hydrogen exchanger family-domain-containing protein [Aspergillus pseudonomiae]|uniref:Sodium/hydrogen exchanger family-domain-containing protein n=1 Tax=Aspergillus pseudonomiae TaxID=1506151 RepID=A0A5N7DSN6_9EURO|nr:Sodium/hydrogen exchanger family-domain-containing protein [Aspergillus pseudonomiae]KAE8409039.1 Sodium/hydrogen exchanger family-domain-containing protein [Aspergillus pseudonomiae]
MADDATRVTPQGGILEGGNPSHYDKKNPIVIFIIQASIIIILCRALHWPLSKIRQPRVIAEVIGGVILGPSVMGRIPGFTEAIFPDASIPNLNLVANLGLILFLFLVGLETDLRFLFSNWRVAASVSAAGMILPFGFGCAISYGLYNTFRNEPGTVPINFGTYLLFIGIAMAITAFPVLCRILTELKLLGTNVGVIVLSAGVGNDVVGWILLALCVALVNAGSGLTALWVLLVCVGYVLFLFLLFRPVFLHFLKKTGSLQKGPSQSVVAVTLLIALASSFFTQVIGVHAIFGGFLIGLLCPHEGGFAIKLTEKIEDLVAALFLPLYFTLSGLQTNLGLLDTGTVWGYVVAVIAIAFVAKVVGGALASRICGLLWRESFSIGVLMSCKGLVELIVLNIGLQANILSTRTFTMFVVMALVTTFVTTPLTTALYPKWYQIKVDRWRRGEIDWNGNPIQSDSRGNSVALAKEELQGTTVRRLLVYLRLDGLSSICTLAALLGPSRLAQPPLPKTHPDQRKSQTMSPEPAAEELAATEVEDAPALQVHGVRLMELTDRDSSVMKVSEIEEYTLWDPVINTFRAFGQWHDMSIMAGVSVVPEHSYADTVVGMAREESSDLLLIPWSETGGMSEHQTGLGIDEASRFANGPYTDFVSNVMRQSSSSVGVLIERSIYSRQTRKSLFKKRSFSAMSVRSSVWNSAPPAAARAHHIVLPFFGGDDDRFALRFVMQLAQNDQVTATIIHIDVAPSPPQAPEVGQSAPSSSTQDKSSSQVSSALQGSESDSIFFSAMKDSLSEELSSRVVFKRVSPSRGSTDAVGVAVTAVKEEMGKVPQKAGNIVVVGRGNNRVDLSDPSSSSQEEIGAEASRVLGPVAQAMVRTENRIVGDVLVLQARVGAVGGR